MAVARQSLLGEVNAVSIIDKIKSGSGGKLVFQPLIEPANDTIFGWEVLFRYSKDNALLSLPLATLPAEDALKFDQYVIALLLLELDNIAGCEFKNKILSINIHAQHVEQLLFDLNMIAWRLNDVGCCLLVELVEFSDFSDIGLLRKGIFKLKEQGPGNILVGIDDYLDGNASAKVLLDLYPRVDVVKISLIHCDFSEKNKIFDEVIPSIQGLGYIIVVEGVETDALRQQTISSGIPLCQGFLWGKPSSLLFLGYNRNIVRNSTAHHARISMMY